MTKKCDKYEAYFTFADDETFKKHLTECEDCRKEHEKMQKVSSLISEVRPLYRKNRLQKLKVACIAFAMVLSSASLGFMTHGQDFVDTVKYGSVLSAEDYGFPVDEYGFLMVE